MAIDIAAFTSRSMIEGLGLTKLTRSELMLARTSAIKHTDKPARLVDLMMRFSLDLLILTPLAAERA